MESARDQILLRGDYVKDLLGDAAYPKVDVGQVNSQFVSWKAHKKEDIMGYRDRACPSVMKGNMSPRHHTPWLNALDDSLETYLGMGEE